MLIGAAGDIHGAMDRLYEDVLAFEAALGVSFEWMLHVGDVGVWPNREHIDKATKTHDGAGDFPAWLAERRPAPRRTLVIKGNHEDFVWLDAQHDPEVLPGLFYPCGTGARWTSARDATSLASGKSAAATGPRTSSGKRSTCRAAPGATTRATRSRCSAGPWP